MRIVVLGAGHVGAAVVEALHEEHDITVIDTDARRLAPLADRYDVRTLEGNGATKAILRQAGVEDIDLLIACSPNEYANLVAATVVKKLSRAKVIVRTSSIEYLEAWREREIDVDFMVSSELETANAILGHIGVPAARQTDVFADGQVQVVEFDVLESAAQSGVIGVPLREAALPPDSRVVAIIRGESMVPARGDERIEPGDRVIVIASPAAAQAWSRVIAGDTKTVEDIVVFGCGRMGQTIARVLLDREIRVRMVDADHGRAQEAAEELQEARVFHASAFDPDFLVRERIGEETAAVFAMNDDAKNLYAGVLAELQGVHLTIALAHDPGAVDVYERAGIDLPLNPRQVIAEELVRFAHDPRIRQIAMLEHDRFEILDLTVRAESELAGRRLDELPQTGSVIGAIVRDGSVIFPHGADVLRPRDRVIIFVESERASLVERVL
ncbi:MAG TPA: Trk system potassium transporter TrkA [Solirubrobacteraceae bacterium]|nr:Trk system potassium transporter TrkA [Solirubrobacteraceae bacterium]